MHASIDEFYSLPIVLKYVRIATKKADRMHCLL